MKLNILFGFTAFILIFSGISSVVHAVFAEDCPGYPNCNNNQTSSTNATVSLNGTSGTTIFNETSSGNATVTYNGTSTNETSSGNATVTYNGTSTNETSSGTGNETNLVQPLIIVPSNMTNEINDTTAPVVPYDIGTIHSSVAAE